MRNKIWIIYIIMLFLITIPNISFAACSHPNHYPTYENIGNETSHTVIPRCTLCNEVLYRTLGSHFYDEDWKYSPAPTCTIDGVRKRSCAGCGYTQTKIAAKLGHNYNTACPKCNIANVVCSRNTSHIKAHDCSLTISTQPQSVQLKKGETAKFSVTATGGNTLTYKYQWYSVTAASGGTSSLISGATSNTYSYKPTQNISGTWYYCIVTNGTYKVTSNRAKLVADITSPTITTASASNINVNKDDSFDIQIIVNDTGQGLNTDSFVASDINIKVNGKNITPTTKNLQYISKDGNNYNYKLTLQGVTGDGLLSLNIANGVILDNVGNGNLDTSIVVTKLVLDNIKPVISANGKATGTKQGYITKNDVIEIPIKITDVGGINSSEFTASDIVIKVGGVVNSDARIRNVTFIQKVGNDYQYKVIIENITGNGTLNLEIDKAKVYDLAGNPNEKTIISGMEVIVDNTKPQITGITLSLGDYNNYSRLYPESLKEENNGWTNEDIYVVINSLDELSGVEEFMRSVGNKSNFISKSGDREIWTNEMDERDVIYYRVKDKAGNISDDFEVKLKIDKTAPNPANLDMRSGRENGLVYTHDALKPTKESIFIKPTETNDLGNYQSGILKTECRITFNNGATINTTELKIEESGTFLKETGTYVIELITTDRAGNTSSKIFYASIDKRTENAINIKNIHDKGSGVEKVIITVRKQGASVDAIEPIIIENPSSNITERIKLTDGIYEIKVQIIDGVGLVKELKQTIKNEL